MLTYITYFNIICYVFAMAWLVFGEARAQQKGVASCVALFGHEMLSLERRCDASLAQAAQHRGGTKKNAYRRYYIT